MTPPAADRLSLCENRAVRLFYHGRRVLVVGADGFLGFHCLRALQQLEAQVSALTRRPAPLAPGPFRRVVRGDLRDRALMDDAVAEESVVFDFAGVAGAVESNRDPERNLEEECRAQLSLFRACAASRSRPLVVFCSSRLVYGKARYLPVDEAHPLWPQSVYAVHKITAENYLRAFGETHGLGSVVLRLSNPYGPQPAGPTRSYGVINQFIRAAARGEPIRIFGDGSQRRDYVFVDDVMSAFLLAPLRGGGRTQIFNLGGRQAISLAEAARQIAAAAGGTPLCFEAWPESYRVVETGDYVSDLREIDRQLKPPAQVPFAEGLRRTMEFFHEVEASERRSAEPASSSGRRSREADGGRLRARPAPWR